MGNKKVRALLFTYFVVESKVKWIGPLVID